MKTVFLSHRHEDRSDANWLAEELERRMRAMGAEIDVFSTSVPAYRFDDFAPAADDVWSQAYHAWVEELRAYLRGHLERAAAYMLLLTRRSATSESAWVRWEIQLGTQLASERSVPFFPCLLGVGYEALVSDAARNASEWQKWEVGINDDHSHPETQFQAVSLDAPDGLVRLSERLRTI